MTVVVPYLGTEYRGASRLTAANTNSASFLFNRFMNMNYARRKSRNTCDEPNCTDEARRTIYFAQHPYRETTRVRTAGRQRPERCRGGGIRRCGTDGLTIAGRDRNAGRMRYSPCLTCRVSIRRGWTTCRPAGRSPGLCAGTEAADDMRTGSCRPGGCRAATRIRTRLSLAVGNEVSLAQISLLTPNIALKSW